MPEVKASRVKPLDRVGDYPPATIFSSFFDDFQTWNSLKDFRYLPWTGSPFILELPFVILRMNLVVF